jgi:hypothetical protein
VNVLKLSAGGLYLNSRCYIDISSQQYEITTVFKSLKSWGVYLDSIAA